MSLKPREDGLPTIGLALIAKDEEASLPRLLDSVQEHVDVVVVCDTGSKDRTVEVAKERGCIVTTFEWCEDFAAARQASYDALPDGVDWHIWADADDTIEGAEKLRALAASAPPNVAGFLMPYDYARDEAGNCICYLERERLVRRGIGERWELPVHEVLNVQGGQLVRSDAVRYVHHRDEETVDPKRNYRILKADLRRSEEEGKDPNPRTLVYLGSEALSLGRFAESVRHLKRYLRVGTWDEELCQASHKLSLAYRAQDQLDRAELAAQRAISHRADWPDGYLDLAEIAMARDQHGKALHFLKIAKQLDAPQTFLITNPLDYSYQPIVMESVCLAKLGRIEEAFEATQAVLAVTPGRPDVIGQAAMLAEALKRSETIKQVLTLYELLVRHDENLKALALLNAAPYYVSDDPAIAAARQNQRENVLHATDPEVYAGYYRENPLETPFEAQEVPIEKAHKRFNRVRFLRDGLAEQAKVAA